MSRPARRLPALLPLLCLLLAAGARAQEPAPPPVLTPQAPGWLVVDGVAHPLPWAGGPAGPLVSLLPVVARLGGELVSEALGEGYRLELGQTQGLLAPGSAAVTMGEEIVPLSQAPQVLGGELLVPVDLLRRTYGDLLGLAFDWPGDGRLVVTRPRVRELPVEMELVHLQGITTLVFRFPERPRYRVQERLGGYDVELVGDRLLPPPRRAVQDPLVRAVAIAPDRIRVDLAPGVRADHYELRDPFRLVLDLMPGGGEVAAAPRPETRRRSPGVRTVVLDPGHGGLETGATGPAGTLEKDLTLLIAQQLEARLQEQLGLKVVLTRSTDIDLGLDERAALANQVRADLFVSIHLNSSPRAGARGAETFFLSLQASDQRAASTAAAENLGLGVELPSSDPDSGLQLILWDLAQSQHLAASQRLATLIQEELNLQLDLRDRGVKQAPFRVLMGASMPAVLVELGFLSTPAEEELLSTPAYRAGLADALVRAISRFKGELEGGGPEPEPPPADPVP
ncbi:MAG TPA: N-acetylmuramoyl-L-alanine amidase [Thermoanaerobaculia bacterium]|nr:N-acetylmuramoyl-L-alanine amidase [Thermoanaerobaculia bacterium]